MPTTNALTTPTVVSGFYGNGYRYEVTEQVNPASTTAGYVALQSKMPPRCQMLWASLANGGTVTISGNDGTATADRYAIVRGTAATQTAPVTGSTVASAAAVIFYGSTTLSSNSVSRRGNADIATNGVNTGSTDLPLFLMPIWTGTATQYVQYYHTGTSTGYKIGSTSAINVRMTFHVYDDAPTNATTSG